MTEPLAVVAPPESPPSIEKKSSNPFIEPEKDQLALPLDHPNDVISITSQNSIFLEQEKLFSKINSFDNIRPLAKTMEEKFEIRVYLVSKTNRKTLREGIWAKRRRKAQEKAKVRARKIVDMKEKFRQFLPWQSTLSEISCKFGNITRSYFDFIQFLTIMNFVLGVYLIYMTTMVVTDSTLMEFKPKPSELSERNIGENNSTSLSFGNRTSAYNKLLAQFELFKPGFRLHPYFHYFGMEEFYDVGINDFQQEYELASNYVNPDENSTSKFESELAFVHKYDEFVYKNFEATRRFSSDLINISISREFNKTCYINANKINVMDINQAGSTMSGLLSGEGAYIEHAPIYYSYYQPVLNDKNITNNAFEHTQFPAEYLVSFLIAFVALLVYLTLRSIKNIQSTAAKHMNTNSTQYTENIFLSWDFSMTLKSAGELKKEALLGQIIEDLEADEKEHTIPCRLFCCFPDQFRIFLNQLFRVILFGIYCSYVVFTVWAISSSVKFKRKNSDNPDHWLFVKLKKYHINLFPIVTILPQLTLSIVTGAGPAISKLLSGLGSFSDEQNFINSIVGIAIIKMMGILLFVVNTIAPLQCNYKGFFGDMESDGSGLMGRSKFGNFLARFGVDVPSNKTVSYFDHGETFTPEISVINSAGEEVYQNDCLNCANDGGCWERNFAKEIYVLVMVEGVVEFLKFLTVERLRALLAGTVNPKSVENTPGVKGKICRLLPKLKQEFEMMSYVMELVTMQCFTWIAMFYCPVLPMILCLRLGVTFTVKKVSLFEYCKPPRRYRFRNADFFYQILLLFYCFAATVSVLLITNAVPSYYCGPLALHHGLELDPSERKFSRILKHYIEHNSESYLFRPNTWSFHGLVSVFYSFGTNKTCLWGFIVMSLMRLAYLIRLNSTNESVINKLSEQNRIEIEQGRKVLCELNVKEAELKGVKQKLKDRLKAELKAVEASPRAPPGHGKRRY